MKAELEAWKLTAYVLGELDEGDRKQVEALLAGSETARREVEEIRQTACGLSEGLEVEPAYLLRDEQRHRIVEQMRCAKIVWFPNWRRLAYATGALAAAAGVLIVAVLSFGLFETRQEAAREGPAPSQQARLDRATAPRDKVVESESAYGSAAAGRASESSRPAVLGPASEVKKEAVAEAAAPPVQAPPMETDSSRLKLDEVRSARSLSPQPPVLEEAAGEAEKAFALATSAPRMRSGAPLQAAKPPAVKALGESAERMSKDARLTRFNTESYDYVEDNPFVSVAQDPLSTFSIDVDTASYSNVRRFVNMNQRPPTDAVRIEELLNYFQYDYAPPSHGEAVVARLEAAPAPWSVKHRLARIGLKAATISEGRRPSANLVFLLDVSGSMDSPEKLPLLRQAMRLLVGKLEEGDRVAIVVYAGASGVVLPSTSAAQKEAILEALDSLEAGGATNGGAGIQTAYEVASANFIKNGVNRVVLATDGDFNVGITNQGDLVRLIKERARQGVFLSVLGFGMGNYKDSALEKLADHGNGNYAYIDTLREAQRVLVEQVGGTLVTVAKDVKIQVEFNPVLVAAYRLLGYENRRLAHQDFNDDAKDAGEMGAGQTVTALYELVPVGVDIDLPSVAPLKYQSRQPGQASRSEELLTVKVRYKEPQEDRSRVLEFPLIDRPQVFDQASEDFRFAAAVAAFGMLLRESPHRGSASFDSVLEIAQSSLDKDPLGYRKEFVELVQRAREARGEAR